MRAVAAIIPLLSRRGLLRLARIAGAGFYRFDAHSRRVALENLRAAFPEMSERRRELIARGSARNFARTFLDLFWARNLTKENYTQFTRVTGAEHFRENFSSAGGHIGCCAHFGNFEWASILSGFVSNPSWIVAQEFKNERLDIIMNSAREVSGHQVVPRTSVLRKMLRALKSGEGVGLLVDMTLPPEMPSVALRAFGGLRICAPILHVILHERTQVPMTPLSAVPRHDGTYDMVYHPEHVYTPGESHAEMAQAAWDVHEAMIRRRPSLWLWSYKHFRYLPEHPEAAYPWYAQIHPAFEKLLQGQPA